MTGDERVAIHTCKGGCGRLRAQPRPLTPHSNFMQLTHSHSLSIV